MGGQEPTLVVLDPEEVDAMKSFRNIPEVTVMQAGDVTVADLIGHASLVVSQSAIEILSSRAAEVKRGRTEDDAGAPSGPGEGSK